MADKPVQRASLKEKLKAFKEKAAGGDADKTMLKKAMQKPVIYEVPTIEDIMLYYIRRNK